MNFGSDSVTSDNKIGESESILPAAIYSGMRASPDRDDEQSLPTRGEVLLPTLPALGIDTNCV